MKAIPLLVKIARRSRRNGDCIEVQSPLDKDGYGRVGHNGRSYRAHRAVWEYLNGPTELPVLHSCDNPPCVNPEHLEPGTHQKNHEDKVARGRWAGGRVKGQKDVRPRKQREPQPIDPTTGRFVRSGS